MNNYNNAGLHVSKLTLGTVQLGIPYGINNVVGKPTEQHSFEILSEAWGSGIVSYDTASAYGQSERILGQFFLGKRPTIVTKLHLLPENTNQTVIGNEMRKMVTASLNHLQLETIPILLLHNTEVLKEYGEAVTAGFQALKEEGWIHQAGISVALNTEEEYQSIWKYLQHDIYEAIQIPMNVFDHRPLHNGCLHMLAAAGKTVFVRSVFLQGLIYMEENELPAHLPEAREPLAKLRELSKRYGISVSQLAVSFIRDMVGVHSLVIGAESAAQVRENIRLMNGPALPNELRQEILEQFRDVPERLITPKLWLEK